MKVIFLFLFKNVIEKNRQLSLVFKENESLNVNNIKANLINDDFSIYDSNKFYDVIVCNPPYFNSVDEKEKCHAKRKINNAKQKGRGSMLVLLHFRRFQPLNSYKKRIRTPCLLQSSSDTFVLVTRTGIEPMLQP